MNLCVNARDAMADGGRLTLKVENLRLTAEDTHLNPEAKEGPYVVLSVEDTGQGIPPGIIKRIFDPFFTTKGAGKGTGLGLSTVIGIVKGHGGFVKVYSEVGRGSVFRVYLPAEVERASAEPSGSTAPMPAGHCELILVVDDEAPIRDAAREVLERHGYRVVLAENVEEAVSRFIECRDDVRLVLADVMMPVMDGGTLIRSLRILEPNLRVIAMSGLGDEGKREEFAALGVTRFLAKPFKPRELLEALQEGFSAGG